MSTKFYTLLTDIGAAKLASAAALGVPLKISDAKPCSRHMIGMSINLQTSGPHWVGAASYLG
ncbi:phage tail-collar fiber domain-containing protein, partial [Salmonella enterica]|uniref:phage tail-collar fiber domain-containing protein n=1 Tax=Salmonella enterica TaxID=28901 RepID=UPI0026164602